MLFRSQEKGIAACMVAAYWDSTGYYDHFFRKGYMIAPSISWQLSPTNKFVAKFEAVHNNESTGYGEPIDPAVGSDGYAVLARGLPRSWGFGSDQDHRVRDTTRLTLELHSTLNDHITSRLMLSADHIQRIDQAAAAPRSFSPTAAAVSRPSIRPAIPTPANTSRE